MYFGTVQETKESRMQITHHAPQIPVYCGTVQETKEVTMQITHNALQTQVYFGTVQETKKSRMLSPHNVPQETIKLKESPLKVNEDTKVISGIYSESGKLMELEMDKRKRPKFTKKKGKFTWRET